MGGKILDYEAKDILNAGKAEGISIGREEGIGIGRMAQLTEQVKKKFAKNKSIEQIAEELEEDVSIIEEIIEKL